MSEKSPGSLHVMVEAVDKDLVQWDLVMQKQGILVVREMIIHKDSDIHNYMFGSMCSFR